MLQLTLQRALLYRHRRLSFVFKNPLPHPATPIAASRFINYGGDPKDKVRFFEQDHLGSRRRVEIDPEAEDRAEQEEIKGHLSDLEQDLECLIQGPYSPDSPFMNELPEKERCIALEALRKYEANKPRDESGIGLEAVFDQGLDDMLREEFDGLAKEEEDAWDPTRPVQEPNSPLTKLPFEVILKDTQKHPLVDRFNECLKKLVNDTNQATSQEIWKWYRRCKQSLPSFLESMPREAATILWDSQAKGEAIRTTPTSHLRTLLEDLRSIGRRPSSSQIFEYIKTLHDEGNSNKALDLWTEQQADLCQGEGDINAYWKLGVQLFATSSDPQRAQDIAFAFLLTKNFHDYRILIPVITAWGRISENEAATKAWALYLKFKTLIGNNMTMEDYDVISVGLLKANRVELALAVFKDMMVTGHDPGNDSTELYKAALGLVENLQASSITERDVNKVSLSALTMLPRRFQNKFFYASWMKKLIGMGELDSAALLVELMYERGIKPDSKHLNGITAAWLRQGSPTSRDKAERLAWAMVQQRIDNVWGRKSSNESDSMSLKPPVRRVSSGTPTSKFVQRTVPPANIETFSILLVHYTRRGDDDMVTYLMKCLNDARIPPNSYIMNHLLYAELRRHNIHNLWKEFKAMSAHIKPDLETYACLWDCGKLQYDQSRTSFDKDFPSARVLYREMMVWFSTLPFRSQNITQEEFSRDLYDQIIRCFCLSKDLHGTLIALHAISHTFRYYPNDDTARMLVLQIARMSGVPPNTPKRRLRRLSSTPRSKENIARVNKLLELLMERKASMLETQGLRVEQLDDHEKKQFRLEIMADLLRIVIQRQATTPRKAQDELMTAAAHMGVGDIEFGSSLEDDLI